MIPANPPDPKSTEITPTRAIVPTDTTDIPPPSPGLPDAAPASGRPVPDFLNRDAAMPGARPALVLLLLINLFNYIDRQVLAAVEPDIRSHFLSADSPGAAFWLELNDNPKFWTGCLSMAFLVCYMLLSPLFGWLADRSSRWKLVALGVLVWTVASGGSGLATTFGIMFLTRCFVGVGEAAYGPVAPTMISDLYPVRRRGSVLAWFYAAIPVGSALGYVLGSTVKGPLGWQWAFYLVVPPGLLLAFACLVMAEPVRGQADAGAAKRPLTRADYLALLRNPSYVYCTLGMTAMTFALGGLAWWMPAYLEEYRQEPASAVSIFGGIVVVTGLSATILGGIVGDKLKPRFSGSYFLVSGIAMLVGFPFIIQFLHTPFPWAWIPLTIAVFCLFFNTGPTNTILANVTHPSIRASAFAINILVIHLLGDVISPPVLGLIIGKQNRYELGFIVVSVTVLVGGVLWLMGMRYLARDTERAPLSLDGPA
jgi:MFS family permease